MTRRNLVRTTGGLELFVALSALGGGYGLLAGPQGEVLGMSTEILEGTPFSNFFIPGLILFVVIGVGAVGAFAAVLASWRYAPFAALAVGLALAGWIAVQVALLGYLSILQPIYFAVGLVLAGLSLRWLTAVLPGHPTTLWGRQ